MPADASQAMRPHAATAEGGAKGATLKEDNMTPHIREDFSTGTIDWTAFAIVDNADQPRDPDEDDDEEDEDEDEEDDDADEPPVVREPDKDET
jgi:hypothetical protein